ncbi:4'-phosphopantetheinyl transferase [Leucogyrophana mollusca]|uniref:4'-phosphopantetheinyl transferase n=1 Tax=Leucogyrophana mollusca TaxID=85980 RepID=A0ACB8BK43_9AGAM|nr:4'-phosphopantetheinyl transferase [Leucogyrophana mollusca]
MPIHGIGVDILHVPRLASLFARRPSRLASRILSVDELSIYNTLSTNEQLRVRFLAVRWAVKEAAYKALYPIRPTWKELTFTSMINGVKPSLLYHPSARPSASSDASGNVGALHVSVSHDGEYVFASVLAEAQ